MDTVEVEKKLVIEFPSDLEIQEISNMSQKMLKSLSVEELALIMGCKVEQTILHIEKSV